MHAAVESMARCPSHVSNLRRSHMAPYSDHAEEHADMGAGETQTDVPDATQTYRDTSYIQQELCCKVARLVWPFQFTYGLPAGPETHFQSCLEGEEFAFRP